MASLLQLLGLGNSSGLPFTLSDDEQQQLAAQQAQQPSGISSLMGTAGQDSTSVQAQPVDAAAQQSLLQSVSKGATGPQDDEQQPTQQLDQSDTGSANNGTDNVSPENSNNPSAQASASVDMPNDGKATKDSTSAGKPGFLSRLTTELGSNPTLGQSLMNAGFGMMAASRYGTPGLAAVGQGAQVGLQTYNALKQQQIQNAMALYQAQNKAAMDNADINSKNATTAQTLYGLNSKKALAAYQQQAGQSFNVQGAIAAGVNPADAKDMFAMLHPELKQVDTGDSIAFVNPHTGSQVGAAIPKTQLVTTKPGETTNVYTPGAGGQASSFTPLATGGLTPEQQKAVNEESTTAAQAQQGAVRMNQMVQLLSDPGYQAAASSGVPGAIASYIGKKFGIGVDQAQILQQQLQNDFNAQNLKTVLGTGINRLDKPVQESIINGSFDMNKVGPQARSQIAQMMLNNYRDTYNQSNRAALWDQKNLGAAAGGDTTLGDGTAVKQGTTRADFLNGKMGNNPLAIPKTTQQAPQIQAELINRARAGDAAAVAWAKKNNIKF